MTTKDFKKTIRTYYQQNRRSFPWRATTNPYHILVSEIMLQQTQTDRVIKYYEQFIREFPTLIDLAHAPLKNILHVWQGLGYNRRALYLQRCAKKVVDTCNGILPANYNTLRSLPGVGDATAGAIMAYAFNKPVPFIETNIRSVYIHFFFKNKKTVSDQQLITLIKKSLDKKNPREWYWALMDYGTMLKKSLPNPSRKSAHYKKQSAFKDSNRFIRGKILALLLENKNRLAVDELEYHLKQPIDKIIIAVDELVKEGLIKEKNNFLLLQ